MIPRTMSHYQLRTECLDETIKTISQNIYITLPVAWAPSQHGGRIPRTSILRESTRWEPQKPQSITPTVLCQLKQSQTPSWVQGEGPALFLLKREPEHEEQKISSRPLWKNTIHPPPKCRIGCPAQQEWWLNSTSFSSI